MQNLGTDGLLLIDSLSGRYNPYIDNAEAAKRAGFVMAPCLTVACPLQLLPLVSSVTSKRGVRGIEFER